MLIGEWNFPTNLLSSQTMMVYFAAVYGIWLISAGTHYFWRKDALNHKGISFIIR